MSHIRNSNAHKGSDKGFADLNMAAKLDKSRAHGGKPVQLCDLSWEKIENFESIRTLAVHLGVDPQTISGAIERGSKLLKKYRVRFVNKHRPPLSEAKVLPRGKVTWSGFNNKIKK